MATFASVFLFTVLQTAAATAPQSLLDDVRTMSVAATNPARFDALTAMLRARNLAFTVERFTIDKPIDSEPRTDGRNVVVTLGEGSSMIVVGAHYDAERLPDGTLSRGAVDNAASSVILVRLAEMLRAEALPMQIKVIWFDMEELGLIGSQKYLEAHRTKPIAAMFNFDVNGYGDTVLFGPSDRKENAGVRRTLLQTCAAEGRSCIAFPQMPPGDERPFAAAGIPTLSIAVLPAVEAHQTWLLVNGGRSSGLAEGFLPAILRTIHTADDTAAKVDGEAMAGMLRFALSLVRSAARS